MVDSVHTNARAIAPIPCGRRRSTRLDHAGRSIDRSLASNSVQVLRSTSAYDFENGPREAGGHWYKAVGESANLASGDAEPFAFSPTHSCDRAELVRQRTVRASISPPCAWRWARWASLIRIPTRSASAGLVSQRPYASRTVQRATDTGPGATAAVAAAVRR